MALGALHPAGQQVRLADHLGGESDTQLGAPVLGRGQESAREVPHDLRPFGAAQRELGQAQVRLEDEARQVRGDLQGLQELPLEEGPPPPASMRDHPQ